MTEDKLIQAIEDGAENGDEPSAIELPPSPRQTLDRTKAVFSVREASQYLGVSVGTVYRRIHTRQLRVQGAPGPLVIQRSELDRATAEPRLRDVIDAVAAARVRRAETARRHVHRLRGRGLTLDQILHDAGDSRKNSVKPGVRVRKRLGVAQSPVG